MSNRAPRRAQPMTREPIEVDENQLRDEFWSLAWKVWEKLDKAIAKKKKSEPPAGEWASLAAVPDLPLVMESWNEAAEKMRRPLLTEGPPRLTEGES